MTLATEADRLLQKTGDPKTPNGHIKTESDEAMTPGSTSGSETGSSASGLLEETIEKIKKRAGLVVTHTEQSTPAAPVSAPTAVSEEELISSYTPSPKPANSSSKKSKKKNTLPDPMKDNHYWERRRKNNEAAKRSRDSRRAKEDQIAIRAALLEQENMRLRIEVAALKEETVKLRAMLYNKK
ncbi:uncharacterized protein [Amphiura filiformis]|uniref:uncharacterized protein n=1 Tax=Amphiura filiformis TaxID=82378 RepID=UPI003B21B049